MLLVNKIIFPVTAYNGCRNSYTTAVSNNIRMNIAVISEYALSASIPIRGRIISNRELPISYYHGNHVDYTVSVLADNPFWHH